MSTPDRFAPIISLWPIATTIRDQIKTWMPEYLAAHERQVGIPPGQTPQLRSHEVRHAAIVRAQEQTPALVIWIAGVTDHTKDPEGYVWGVLQLGVMLVASSNDTAPTGDLLHRYAAATKALLRDWPTAGAAGTALELIDEDYTGVDPLKERTLLSVDLSYELHGVLLGQEGAGPPRDADPRPDPTAPWPGAPTAETTHLDITAVSPSDPIDPED